MFCDILQESFFLVLSVFCLLNFTFSQAQMVPAMFVFGDSLIDVGNNNFLTFSVAKANYRHYGIDFPTKKPNGRFCNGKNAADFLAEKVGLPTSPPYLSLKNKNNTSLFTKGVSFASAAAGILEHTNRYLGRLTLTKQVEDYAILHEDLVKHLGSTGAQQHLSKSLFLVVIGNNDILDYMELPLLRMKHTIQQFVSLIFTELEAQLQRMYNFGARKFVVNGLPPIGCTPQQRAKSHKDECNEEGNSWCVLYNEGLKLLLQKLKSELPDFSYVYFDTYNVVQNIIQNPATYGFKEVKKACCGLGRLRAGFLCVPFSIYCHNRTDHLFWDFCHPTEAADRILVDIMFDDPSQYTFPINVRQLVAV